MSAGRPRTWLAVLLAFVAPGLGHYYASFLPRAFAMLVIVLAARLVFGVVFTASGGRLAINATCAALIAGVGLFVVVDAARCARRGVHPPAPRFRRTSRYLIYAVFALVVVSLQRSAIRSSWYETYHMPSVGMDPTMLPGDYFTVDKRAYRDREPRVGEVIALERPGSGHMRVKRIIAGPGDVVYPSDPAGQVLVNGNPVPGVDSDPFPDVALGPGEYFVLGDNPRTSTDSRSLGAIPRTDVVGRVAFVHFSVDPESRSPRWDRIGNADLHWPE